MTKSDHGGTHNYRDPRTNGHNLQVENSTWEGVAIKNLV